MFVPMNALKIIFCLQLTRFEKKSKFKVHIPITFCWRNVVGGANAPTKK
jgi:hypothetical protein